MLPFLLAGIAGVLGPIVGIILTLAAVAHAFVEPRNPTVGIRFGVAACVVSALSLWVWSLSDISGPEVFWAIASVAELVIAAGVVAAAAWSRKHPR